MRWKWHVRTPLIGGLACIFVFLAAVPADAQRRRPPPRRPSPPPVQTPTPPTRAPTPQVRDADPDVVRLSKGGDHKLITITGRSLERFVGGRIERPNGRALNARVTLPGRSVPPGGLTRRVVRVQATEQTGNGNNLRLVLTTRRDRRRRATEVNVPVRLVVLDAVRIDRARARGDLEAGGEAVRYEIAGQGLWQLHHPRLERNGRTVRGSSVEFVDRKGRETTFMIHAGPDVAAGRAQVVAGTIDRPVTIGPVTVVEPLALERLDVPDLVEAGAAPVTGTVVLNQTAPSGIEVALDAVEWIEVPTRITIEGGADRASFPIGVDLDVVGANTRRFGGWIQADLRGQALRQTVLVRAVELRLVHCDVKPEPRIFAGEPARLEVGIRNEGTVVYPSHYGGGLSNDPVISFESWKLPGMQRHSGYGRPFDLTVEPGKTVTISFEAFPSFELAQDWSNSNAGRYRFRIDLVHGSTSLGTVECGPYLGRYPEVVNPPGPKAQLRQVYAPDEIPLAAGSVSVEFLLENDGGWIAVYEDGIPVELVEAQMFYSNNQSPTVPATLTMERAEPLRLEAGERARVPASISLPPDVEPGWLELRFRLRDLSNLPGAAFRSSEERIVRLEVR